MGFRKIQPLRQNLVTHSSCNGPELNRSHGAAHYHITRYTCRRSGRPVEKKNDTSHRMMSYSSFILRNGSFISERTTFSFLSFFSIVLLLCQKKPSGGALARRGGTSRAANCRSLHLTLCSFFLVQLISSVHLATAGEQLYTM